MSDRIAAAVEALNGRIRGGFDGVAKFVIPGEGAILLSASGAVAGEGPADVTLTADLATFRAILEGETSPTAAFMSGRLRIEGDMGLALKLAGRLG